jgi:hypothetical protein
VDGSTHRADADRELSDLRARADGPDPDIDRDPGDSARSHAFEAAGAVRVRRPADWWRSLWRGATREWWSPLVWVAAAIVVAAMVLAVFPVSAPRPDAKLRPIAAEADSQFLALLAEEVPRVRFSLATLRAYESYRGLEIWTGANEFGSPCLIAVDRADGTVSEMRCAPPPAELIMDVSSIGDDFEGLPGQGIVRFIHRGDSIDAYLHLLSEAG